MKKLIKADGRAPPVGSLAGPKVEEIAADIVHASEEYREETTLQGDANVDSAGPERSNDAHVSPKVGKMKRPRFSRLSKRVANLLTLKAAAQNAEKVEEIMESVNQIIVRQTYLRCSE